MNEFDNITDAQLAAVDFDQLAKSLNVIFNEIGKDETLEDAEKTTVLAGATFGALIGVIKILGLHQRNNRERDRVIAASVGSAKFD